MSPFKLYFCLLIHKPWYTPPFMHASSFDLWNPVSSCPLDGFGLSGHDRMRSDPIRGNTVEGRNPAPPKTLWGDASPLNTNKQWFAMGSTWCRISSNCSMRISCTPGPFGGHQNSVGIYVHQPLFRGSPLKLIAICTSCRSLPKIRVQFMG